MAEVAEETAKAVLGQVDDAVFEVQLYSPDGVLWGKATMLVSPRSFPIQLIADALHAAYGTKLESHQSTPAGPESSAPADGHGEPAGTTSAAQAPEGR